MDPSAIQTLFRFNTFANEGIRQALVTAEEGLLRRPLEEYWFESVFSISRTR